MLSSFLKMGTRTSSTQAQKWSKNKSESMHSTIDLDTQSIRMDVPKCQMLGEVDILTIRKWSLLSFNEKDAFVSQSRRPVHMNLN